MAWVMSPICRNSKRMTARSLLCWRYWMLLELCSFVHSSRVIFSGSSDTSRGVLTLYSLYIYMSSTHLVLSPTKMCKLRRVFGHHHVRCPKTEIIQPSDCLDSRVGPLGIRFWEGWTARIDRLGPTTVSPTPSVRGLCISVCAHRRVPLK